MRVSVCEFLRIATEMDWFYKEPGHWVSGDCQFEALREGDHTFKVYRGKRVVRTLHYFEGMPSYMVRRIALKARRR